jgi:hypothetical protein
MRTLRWSAISLAVLVLAGSGCATKPPAEIVSPVAAETTRWLRTELYFAIGDWTETALSTEPESRWAVFLDAEVTPRFPDGLSVLDVYGQWREAKPGAAIKRERSRLLVIVHADTPEASAKIDAIRDAWKRATGEQSVLRVSQPAQASF